MGRENPAWLGNHLGAVRLRGKALATARMSGPGKQFTLWMRRDSIYTGAHQEIFMLQLRAAKEHGS